MFLKWAKIEFQYVEISKSENGYFKFRFKTAQKFLLDTVFYETWSLISFSVFENKINKK